MPDRDETAGAEYPPPLPEDPEVLPLDVDEPPEVEVLPEVLPEVDPPPLFVFEDVFADAAAAAACSRRRRADSSARRCSSSAISWPSFASASARGPRCSRW